MIPILRSEQIKAADAYTIEREPIPSIDLMERAVDRLLPYFLERKAEKFHILCGTGNNGGDGVVLARKFWQKCIPCRVSVADFGNRYSADFSANLERLKMLQTETPVEIRVLKKTEDLELKQDEILIDALFGNGLNKPLEGDFLQLIRKINGSGVEVYSIDMPSGLLAEGETDTEKFVQAEKTFVLECPRIALFNPAHRVDFELVSIGLDKDFIHSQKTQAFVVEATDVQLKKRSRFSYKNIFGHLLVAGGSKGMYGAPVLSAKAAFKCGAGLVTCLVPEQGSQVVHAHLAEAMVRSVGETCLEGRSPGLSRFTALAVGMGMGTDKATFEFLTKLLHEAEIPVLLDADALNLIAENKATGLIKPGSILTPHEGEFRRLVGEWCNDEERLNKLRNLAKQTDSIVVLKGTYTAIAEPLGNIYFNTTGSVSLATAGTGDVLSGMIGAFMVQGYTPLEAALRGVYYHGKAGENFGGKPVRAGEIAEHIAL